MIVDSISDVVEIIDQRGIITYSNLSSAYQEMLGVDQVLGSQCRLVYGKLCISCDECPMDEVFVTGKSITDDRQVNYSDAKAGWVRQRLYPMFNENGWVSGVLRIVFDITREKRKEIEEAKYLDALEQSLHNHIQGNQSITPQALSAREREILLYLADGMSNPEIARLLGISAHTVKTHVVHILNKLNAKDRTQAAVTATRLKII